MPTRTGTASQINASGGNDSTTVTVPDDADLVVAFWAHWDNNGGSTLSSLTLDGDSFVTQVELAEGEATDESGIGIAVLANPTTGAGVTVEWEWSAGGARAEGGEIVLVYLTDGNIGDPVRDAAANATTEQTDVSVTIDTAEDDLVLGFAERFDGPPSGSPAISLTAFIDNASLNSHIYDVGEDTTPDTPTATVSMTGENYSVIAAISLKAVVEGGDEFQSAWARNSNVLIQ